MDRENSSSNYLSEELKHANKEIEHEKEMNNLLLKELHSVQEKLEVLLKNDEKKEKKINEFKKTINSYTVTITRLENELFWFRAVLRKMNDYLWKKNWLFRRKIRREANLLATTKYFDINYYLENYPDVKNSRLTAQEHYLLHGANEGRKASVDFDTRYYIQIHEDIAKDGEQPLLHYIKYGIAEKRKTKSKGK